MPIHAAVEGLSTSLATLFAGTTPDATEENLQSRARGTLLMAISNKFGPMVLTTGNKSEVSVGYATLYGDMNGGFNPIKDLYKTQVYALARYRNAARPKGCLGPDGIVIPENVLTKAPTAELKPGPARPGHAAALRRARRHPQLPGRAARCRCRRSSRAGMRRRPSRRSSACSISPNTSGGRRRRA